MPYLHVPGLDLGPFTVQVFGVFAALAVVLGLRAARVRAGELGLEAALVDRMAPWMLVGVIVGAHLVSVLFYSPGRILSEPLVLIKFWDGISSFGGSAGGLVVVFLFLRRLGVKKKHYIQAFLFGAVVSLLVGRMGCAVVHDHPGKETTSPVAIKGWPTAETPQRSLGFYSDGPRRHDLGLYEFLYLIPVTGILYATRRWRPFEYFHVAMVLYLYAPARFLLDFLRAEDRRYFALTPGQYFSILMFLVAVSLTIRGKRMNQKSDVTTTT